MKLKKFNVSSLTNYIKVSLESDILLSNINVSGEVSNLKKHTNGNIYFSLKDNDAKINCVMFTRYIEELDFDMQDGDQVDIIGKISVYMREGTYQLICYMIEKEGMGDLHNRFEILKESLKKKGYFDEDKKKPIPSFCFNIGVITSKTGAVIQDILNVSTRKNPFVTIKIFNSLVQGEDAYKDIIQGIRYFNIEKNVDVIIIARGGGSLEDLWVFNNELLAEEIYKSEIPIVSGVGHETDFTICDFVSDLRASTPTAAAEICIPDIESIMFSIDNYRSVLDRNIRNAINVIKNSLYNHLMSLKNYSPKNIIKDKQIEINKLSSELRRLMKNSLLKVREEFLSIRLKLEKNDINQILDKGFVLLYDDESKIIKSSNDIDENKNIFVMFKDEIVEGQFIKREVRKNE